LMDFHKLLKEERQKFRNALKNDPPPILKPSSDEVLKEEPIPEAHDMVEIEPLPTIKDMKEFILTEYSNIFLIPFYVGIQTEINLFTALKNTDVKWKILSGRQSIVLGTVPRSGMVRNDDGYRNSLIPRWLNEFIDHLVQIQVFDIDCRPNNILINKYNPTEGILHHTDGPSYHDKVAVLSLGSDCIMSFRHKLNSDDISGLNSVTDVFSVILPSRSLFCFSNDVYTKFMHGIIAEPTARQVVGDYGSCLNADILNIKETDSIIRGDRISITFRKVKAEYE